jgi:hypothetical protein
MTAARRESFGERASYAAACAGDDGGLVTKLQVFFH